MSANNVFPFTRIVGQDNMKRALMLNVIDPGIGGVLIKGEKGTAKSTTVRSMNAVLPYRKVVKGFLHLEQGYAFCLFFGDKIKVNTDDPRTRTKIRDDVALFDARKTR